MTISGDMLIFTPTKRIFPDSQILSHWYHFEAQLVGNNIWKKNRNPIYWLFGNIKLHSWKQTFGDLFLSKHQPTHPFTTPKPSCSEKMQLHEVVLNVLFKSMTDCWASSCDHVWHRSKFYLVAMATIEITHFDQLGTVCNDYSEEYRYTAA